MEQWKNIKGYEDYYEVSNLGRVRNKVTGNLLKPRIGAHDYRNVELGYVGRHTYRVHQLVLRTFDPNGYFDGAEIDHKDGDKSNNCLSNLEWVTHAENVRRLHTRLNKPMIGVSADGEIHEFYIASDFAREHGLTRQAINQCLDGLRGVHKGWVFYYKEEGNPRRTDNGGGKSTKLRSCIGISPDGVTYEFTSQAEFAKEHDLERKQINACLNGRVGSHKNWTFNYKED